MTESRSVVLISAVPMYVYPLSYLSSRGVGGITLWRPHLNLPGDGTIAMISMMMMMIVMDKAHLYL